MENHSCEQCKYLARLESGYRLCSFAAKDNEPVPPCTYGTIVAFCDGRLYDTVWDMYVDEFDDIDDSDLAILQNRGD